MKLLFNYFGVIKDKRRDQGKRFPLPAMLEMVVLAGLSGHFGINSISRFIKNNSDFFIDRYTLLHKVPSKTTIFKFLSTIDYEELNDILVEWILQFTGNDSKFWVSIDGKALCSTVTNSCDSKQNYKSIVSAFCSELEIVLDTRAMETKKSDEANLARDLIRNLELKGITFTLDALHCQKKQLKPSWSQEMIM